MRLTIGGGTACTRVILSKELIVRAGRELSFYLT